MKLSGITIIIIFLVFGFSALLYSYFQVYAPNETAAGYMHTYKDQLDAESGKQSKAVARVKDAMAQVQAAADAWNIYVAQKTPSDSLATGGINIFENSYQLVVDSPKFRNSAQRAFNAQIRAGGIKVISSPDLPQPTDSEKDILVSYYNFPAFNFPVVLWELGSVTVQGTYDQIAKNVRAWSSMPHYLAVVDGLRIDGTSPTLTASYNVTLVGFIHATKVFPAPGVVTGSGSGNGATSTPTMPGRGGPNASGGAPTQNGGVQAPAGSIPGAPGGKGARGD